MKRLRSSDDLGSYQEESLWRDSGLNRSSSFHRSSFYYKSDGVRKNMSSSSSSRNDRDRSVEGGDRATSRISRRRWDHDSDGFERRKGFEYSRWYSGGDRGSFHRSESFCGRRGGEFPKGFRSERERLRHEGSVSSWRRFRDFEDSGRGGRSRGSKRTGTVEVRSPTWSRDSRSSRDAKSSEKEKERGDKEKSSPTWSKDSGSGQSKSVEAAKKSGEMQVQSRSHTSSEMEEGELELALNRESEPVSEVEPALGVPTIGAGSEDENRGDESEKSEHDVNIVVEDENRGGEIEDNHDGSVGREGAVKASCKQLCKERDIASICEKKCRVKGNDELSEYNKKSESVNEMTSNGDETESADGRAGIKEVKFMGNNSERKEDMSKNTAELKQLHVGECNGNDTGKQVQTSQDIPEDKQMRSDLESKMEHVEVPNINSEVLESKAATAMKLEPKTETLEQNIMDKGKSLAVASSDDGDSPGDMCREGKRRDEAAFRNNEMEGPSTRGFELLSNSPIKKWRKEDQSQVDEQKDRKLTLESPDLSLSLPNILLPIDARETNLGPDSPFHDRSVQSLTNPLGTDSDGFTASVSFSGSQSFFHNPSCSLTHNSLDNLEQSVGSRPLFQAVDWQALSQNASTVKEVPLYQRVLMNENGSHQENGSHHKSQKVQGQSLNHLRSVEGSSKVSNGLERHLAMHKELRNHDSVKSPSNSVGSHEIGSSCSLDKRGSARAKNSGTLYGSTIQRDPGQLIIGGVDFVEAVVVRIVSDPVHVMARKFHEMTGQSIACLKESIHEIMLNADKRGQVSVFQKLLQNRSDIALAMLQKAHRAQLEILVALKTGLPNFLQLDYSISSSDLAEIYLNLRCRNLTCRSVLPVDECDCKVCSQRNGFCSACMCLVCSRFDMASNTCSWVGCDVCLHWCHADCGLQDSYIRNGRSASGPHGTTEMQFHCVACGHPSEMFGFVKEVFQNFAKDWTVEIFLRELEYVKRIFNSSKDTRGRQLFKLADQMLVKLADKSNLPEIYSHVMGFLADGNSAEAAEVSFPSGSQVNNGVAGPSQEPSWLKSIYNGRAPQVEKATAVLPSSRHERNNKCSLESELHRSAQKETLFDELESIVRTKREKAKMFQGRADDARREAEGLKRIAIAKSKTIEEEFSNRIGKLRMVEAEEIRRQKLQELQALERAHQEYLTMKMRMEVDIKNLLLKMEATKQNLAM